ncbi:Transcriptional regulator [uncultured Candidatus Thioglobus sp.]|nr:Transcriptional regulator [uncultured Candidatus Thioglobus sp.]
MHIPKKFKQNDLVQFKQLINKYPFASLITNSKSELEVNHIPLILNQSNEKQVLHGHIAKANPLWKNLKGKSEVLVVFNGPNCYISPNYYPTKKETGKVVPTWNYVALHIKGTISFIHDNQWKLNMVNNLTKQHENEQPIPWSVSDAPDEYIQKMLSAIVGLEIEILSSTSQWKVSQNQPEQNKQGVIAGLSQESESNYQKIAKLVANNAVKIC